MESEIPINLCEVAMNGNEGFRLKCKNNFLRSHECFQFISTFYFSTLKKSVLAQMFDAFGAEGSERILNLQKYKIRPFGPVLVINAFPNMYGTIDEIFICPGARGTSQERLKLKEA